MELSRTITKTLNLYPGAPSDLTPEDKLFVATFEDFLILRNAERRDAPDLTKMSGQRAFVVASKYSTTAIRHFVYGFRDTREDAEALLATLEMLR